MVALGAKSPPPATIRPERRRGHTVICRTFVTPARWRARLRWQNRSPARSAAPDATALGLCLDAILESQALDGNSRLNLTESQIFLDAKTTIVDGSVELTDQHGAITEHGFHCEVEGRKVASLNIRSR